MNSDYTHISILLDGSGSMHTIVNDVIGGFNTLISEQKKVPGKLTVTLAKFSSPGDYDYIYDVSDISTIKDLSRASYIPSGATALLDSAAKLIDETGAKLAAMQEQDRPAKVLVVMITDGEENSSKSVTKDMLATKIKVQQEQYNWQFSYIGANQDSFDEGQKIGVTTNAVNFKADSKGVGKVYNAVSDSITNYRGVGNTSFRITQDDVDNG